MKDKSLNTAEQAMAEQPHKHQQIRRSPVVDIYETPECMVVQAELPGVDEQGLQIQFQQGVLTIDGTADVGDSAARTNYFRQFRLKDSFDIDAAEAELKQGLLTLRLPVAEDARPKQIGIKSLH